MKQRNNSSETKKKASALRFTSSSLSLPLQKEYSKYYTCITHTHFYINTCTYLYMDIPPVQTHIYMNPGVKKIPSANMNYFF